MCQAVPAEGHQRRDHRAHGGGLAVLCCAVLCTLARFTVCHLETGPEGPARTLGRDGVDVQLATPCLRLLLAD